MGESHDEDFLTKKMEEMRKKNEEILKRYQEVEQDKMCADQFSNSAKEKRKNMDPEKVVHRVPVVRTPRNRIPSTESQPNNSPKSCGPPPDPNYNFLSDRSRKRSDSSNEGNWRDTEKDSLTNWGQPPRHYKNYGGSDFRNVKSTMEKQKASYKRNHAGSLQNPGDLTMQMTGRQRIQYEEWKKEREKVDQARIDRQRGSDGAWRREWDSHKHLNKNNGEDEENEHGDENPHYKLQGQNLPVKGVDGSSNLVDVSRTSLMHSTNDDVSRFPKGDRLFKFRPTEKSSRCISDGDGRLSITLTNNIKHPQEPDNRDARSFGKSTQRKEIELSAPRTKSSSWTYLVSESSSPPSNSNYSHMPKPLYPGWQTVEGNKNSKEQETSRHIGLVNARNQLESQADLSEKFNLLSTSQARNIGSATDREIAGVGVHDCIKESPKKFGKSVNKLEYDSDIYYSDESPQKIEILRSSKPCVQEVKCKLAGLKLSEEGDDEWENESEEAARGSSSGILYSDESPKKIDDVKILRTGKPCVQKVEYWLAGLKTDEEGTDKIEIHKPRELVKEVKCKFADLKTAKEKDDEWEDVSEEDESEEDIYIPGSDVDCSDIYNIQMMKRIDELDALERSKLSAKKVEHGSASLNIGKGRQNAFGISKGAPGFQEVKCKLADLKTAEEKDDEWEDLSEEEICGSGSDENRVSTI